MYRLLHTMTFCLMLSASAAAEEIPAEFRGEWASACGGSSPSTVQIGKSALTVRHDEKNMEFVDVMISHTFYGGAKADGSHIWLLADQGAGGAAQLVVELPGYGRKGALTLEVDRAPGLEALHGVEFIRCH